jgi:hypothetical protein
MRPNAGTTQVVLRSLRTRTPGWPLGRVCSPPASQPSLRPRRPSAGRRHVQFVARSDFSRWMSDVFGDHALARELRDHQRALRVFVCRYSLSATALLCSVSREL